MFSGAALHPLVWGQIPCHYLSACFPSLRHSFIHSFMYSGSAGSRINTLLSRSAVSFATPPLRALTPASLASVPNLTLMQSERALELFRHLCSAPPRLVSNLALLHCICSAPGLQSPPPSLGSPFPRWAFDAARRVTLSPKMKQKTLTAGCLCVVISKTGAR